MSQLKDDIVQDVCTASHPVLRPGPVFRVSCFIWMAYLSLRIMLCPLTPLPCFAGGAGVLLRPPPGLGVKECGCKMYLGYSGRGQ